MSAWKAWQRCAYLGGWFLPEEKSPLPESVDLQIGVVVNRPHTPEEPTRIQMCDRRRQTILDTIDKIMEDDHLPAGPAGKLLGQT